MRGVFYKLYDEYYNNYDFKYINVIKDCIMKPEIFIGSSREGKSIAYAVQEELNEDANVTVWSQGIFRLSTHTVDELLEALEKSDFSVFIFSPDDTIEIRDEQFAAVRDNVIFELGLSIGKLDKQRSFFILPDNNKDIRLPTDLLGLISATYDAERIDNLQAAVGSACNKIRKAIKTLGKRRRPLIMPSLIENQPEDAYYHLRFQRLITAESESNEAEFSFNLSKNAFTMIATKLYHGRHVNISGIAITGVEVNTGMVSLMILRSKERKNVESLKNAGIDVKEKYWNELRYSFDVDDITSELDISMRYDGS